MNIEQCIAQAGSFVGMMQHLHSSMPGLLLKSAVWGDGQLEEKASQMEAKSVSTDIRVSLEVLAPHTAGGYQILDPRGGK